MKSGTLYRYDPENDPYSSAFVQELSMACAPFIKHGSALEISRKAGFSSMVLTLMKAATTVEKTNVSLGMALRALPYFENGPRVYLNCEEKKYDLTGDNWLPVMDRLSEKVEELLGLYGNSFHEVSRQTGVDRRRLSEIKRKNGNPPTVRTIMTVMHALCGDIDLELYDPASEVRLPRTVALSDSETPYIDMTETIRKACVRNMKFLDLCPMTVSKEAEVELALMQGFFNGIPVALTLSVILDIAKACQCEINLSVR